MPLDIITYNRLSKAIADGNDLAGWTEESEAINTQLTEKASQEDLDTANATLGSVKTEVESARGSNVSLSERLDDHTTQLAQKANQEVFVEDYGILPDGSDISVKFDVLLNDIQTGVKKSRKIRFSKGEYAISKPILPNNYYELIGDDTIIVPHDSWVSRNVPREPLLGIVGVDNVIVSGITFDLKQDTLPESTYNPYSAILMLATKRSEINKCKFTNIGVPNESSNLPSRSAILLVSQDNLDDDLEIPDSLNMIGATEYNKIEECDFLNTNCKTEFAIRLKTNWDKIRPVASIENLTQHNVITKCEFEGNFYWNNVELAGPGTRSNVVEHCKAKGMSIGNFDIDKGASYNKFFNLEVTESGMPTVFFEDSTKRYGAISVHGSTQYQGVGNVVSKCRVHDITNPNTDSSLSNASAILVDYAEETIIEGNIIENILARYGSGIFIAKNVKTSKFLNNHIKNVSNGFNTDANNTILEDIVLEGNEVRRAKVRCVSILIADGYKPNRIKLNRNTLIKDVDDDNTQTALVVKGLMNSEMIGNYIEKGAQTGDGVSVSECDATFEMTSNNIYNASTGIRLNNPAQIKMLFNNVFNSTTQLTITGGSVEPYKLQNTFS